VTVEREEPDPNDPALTVWTDYTSLLATDSFTRPHFVAGGRFDGTGGEAQANEKVWGPGYRFAFSDVGSAALPGERLRVTAADVAGKTFCGVYTFAAGGNGSFTASAPESCQ
jgi:hypothetical protein